MTLLLTTAHFYKHSTTTVYHTTMSLSQTINNLEGGANEYKFFICVIL